MASVDVDKDQRIPSHLATRFFRRGGQAPVVRSVTLDTNFHAIDVEEYALGHIETAKENDF